MKIVKRETRSKSKAHQALTGALHEAKIEPKTEETSSGKGKVRTSNRAIVKVEKEAVQQQQSYIMKLFDRSVNLAKFDESTPLYPIIRDWLRNAPRQKPSNDADDEDQEIDLKDGEVGHMPIVEVNDNVGKFKKEKIDPDLKSIDDLDSENPKITKEELLEEHKRKWSKIRENWLDNNKKFKSEYFQDNIKILESLKKNL